MKGKNDRMDFSTVMYPFGKLYDLALEDSKMFGLWWDALKEYDIEEVVKAVQKFIKSPDFGNYKPKPADIIKMIEGTSSDRSLLAWSKVEKAIRRVGSYQTVSFDDPIIHRVIEDMGGWVAMCGSQENELPFVSKEFCTRYRGFSVMQEIPQHPTRLFGIIDCDNSANGYRELSRPVFIGDQQKAAKVLEGGMQPNDSLLLIEGENSEPGKR